MSQVLFLIPLSIGMGLIGFGVFVWALRNGQFEDPEGNARRVLTPLDPPLRTGRGDDGAAPETQARDRPPHQTDAGTRHDGNPTGR